MRYLLDTQLLLWVAMKKAAVPRKVANLLSTPANEFFFSSVSLWETAIKFSRGKPDFTINPVVLRRELLRHDFFELDMNSEHALGVADLPWIHKDPFDRLLVAQATAEGITLLTADALLGTYPGPVVKV